MIKTISALMVMGLLFMAMRTDKPAYRIFDVKGKASSYSEMLEEALKADVVFFGELHDVPLGHWMEYEFLSDLYQARKHSLIAGAEMFESDNQLIIDEYFSGKIKEKSFETEARLWPNYKPDYKPLLTFAKDSSLRFVATNIPRRYASMVNSWGFETLDSLAPEAYPFIAPLPVSYDPELDCYKEIMKSMGENPSHATMNIAKAQAIKDATMAHFIAKNYKSGALFLHFNGSYHSDHFQGIVWYLKKTRPDLKITVISSVQQEKLDDLDKESEGLADFVIVFPESMTHH